MQSILGTDGIRGRFNEETIYSLGYKVGYAIGSTLIKIQYLSEDIQELVEIFYFI